MLGAKIAQIRYSLGDTQEDFGKRFEKKQSTIASWENGTKKPRHQDLVTIAKLGQITVDELLGVTHNSQSTVDNQTVDVETQKVITDLTRRLQEAKGVEKKFLLKLLRGIAESK